ncbi:MAG: NYN domain-containing protein [Thermomicrobiales bacterium]|nr:NYN domain-containing protein [Thermomicrobiales bacterium]MCO5222716.1 NYN domain-containing protein [Thermomicrobiales bacterium]
MRPRPRAIVYFDGFNFYYGCFKSSRSSAWRACKWLDLESFCREMFPAYEISKIRYFTARVNPTPLDPGTELRQAEYLRAIATLPTVSIHEGTYSTHRKERYLADPSAKKPTLKVPHEKVHVIVNEGKGSDVSLATHLVADGFRNAFDVAIVISNDSDLYEPIRVISDASELGRPVLLVNPHPHSVASRLRQMPGVQYWKMTLNKLQNAQLPNHLRDADGTITKPLTW